MKALCLYLHMVLFVFNLVAICFWLNLAMKGLKFSSYSEQIIELGGCLHVEEVKNSGKF